jgi:hypothetical protein
MEGHAFGDAVKASLSKGDNLEKFNSLLKKYDGKSTEELIKDPDFQELRDTIFSEFERIVEQLAKDAIAAGLPEGYFYHVRSWYKHLQFLLLRRDAGLIRRTINGVLAPHTETPRYGP